jgi:precorrin-6B methylase 2
MKKALLFVNKKKQKNFVTWDTGCGSGSATCVVLGE